VEIQKRCSLPRVTYLVLEVGNLKILKNVFGCSEFPFEGGGNTRKREGNGCISAP